MAWKLFQRRPERILQLAIQRMMPKNKIGRHMLAKLKLFVGAQHPHQAQAPIPLDAAQRPPRVRRGRLDPRAQAQGARKPRPARRSSSRRRRSPVAEAPRRRPPSRPPRPVAERRRPRPSRRRTGRRPSTIEEPPRRTEPPVAGRRSRVEPPVEDPAPTSRPEGLLRTRSDANRWPSDRHTPGAGPVRE